MSELELNPTTEFQRGSAEETRRILQEINKINMAFGYKKRMEIAAPRTNEHEYFFSKPEEWIPRSLRKRVPIIQRSLMLVQPSWTPYWQMAPIYLAPIETPREGRKRFEEDKSKSKKKLLKLQNLERRSKQFTFDEGGLAEEQAEELDEEEDLLDSLVDAIVGSETPEIPEYAEEEEDNEKNEPNPENPPLKNDKFIHNEMLEKQAGNATMRAFNLTGSGQEFFRNLTNRFMKTTPAVMTTTRNSDEEDVDEEYEDTEAEVDGLKAPWGALAAGQNAQKEVFRQGGLIIQRLRVRNGSIAVAGPGGVATAGSGGTAIVGPEGVAITHPRSLTIAGPGAKVYEVPESSDLKEQLLATNVEEHKPPPDGVLVATGPTIFYSE